VFFTISPQTVIFIDRLEISAIVISFLSFSPPFRSWTSTGSWESITRARISIYSLIGNAAMFFIYVRFNLGNEKVKHKGILFCDYTDVIGLFFEGCVVVKANFVLVIAFLVPLISNFYLSISNHIALSNLQLIIKFLRILVEETSPDFPFICIY